MPSSRQPNVARVPSPEEIDGLIERYTWRAAVAMFAIPVPGVDLAATFAVWGLMVRKIAHAHGEELGVQDATHLASDLLKNAVLAGVAWIGSATLAAELLKTIPVAGTLAAYVLDAGVAAAAAKRLTAAVGRAAESYFASGKTAGPQSLREHFEVLRRDPVLRRSASRLLQRRRKG